MWNPESTDMESRIHSVESGIQDSLGLPYMGRNYRFHVNAYKHLTAKGLPAAVIQLGVKKQPGVV